MMISSLILAAAATAAPAVSVEWSAPAYAVAGTPYDVDLHIEVGAGETLPRWALGPACFSLGGESLGARDDAPMDFGTSARVDLSLDLSPWLAQVTGAAELSCDLPGAGPAVSVSVLEKAPDGLDFMAMPVEELGKYNVLLRTNRGDMLAEFWPDKAPNHVRNFLDLSYTGFYDGLTFHRVIPGFMIQGGDPTGTGTGSGPRQLKAEFSDAKHVPGVLSMARSQDPDSASCQFFIMHGTAPHLDGAYSAFGKLRSGLEVVDEIVNTPRGAGDRPLEKQSILSAVVVMAPAE